MDALGCAVALRLALAVEVTAWRMAGSLLMEHPVFFRLGLPPVLLFLGLRCAVWSGAGVWARSLLRQRRHQ